MVKICWMTESGGENICQAISFRIEEECAKVKYKRNSFI